MRSRLSDAAIKIENAVVSYRDSVALRGVSLTVNEGQFVGVIGPNGAGKTTLLSAINGMVTLSSGSVTVLGQLLSGPARRQVRKRVGYVPQAENVDRRMPVTVRDAVMIGRYGRLGLLRGPTPADGAAADAAIEMVGLTQLARRPVGHLSGGESQRAAIARCLAQEPRILLLDELTASLDWKSKADILQMVARIHAERDITTLFVTHDIDALPHTCDRVILMKQGAVVEDGPPDRVITTRNLSRLYGLPEEVVDERRPHVHSRTVR